MQKQLLNIALIVIISSCGNDANDKNPVAKVYNNVLFEEDITAVLPEQLTKEDSILFVNSFINKWAREQLLLQKAKINLNKEEESIDKLVQQYKHDLLINK